MPSWAPDSMNEVRPVMVEGAARAGVTGAGPDAQAGPVDGHVAELLGHEPAGQCGDRQHDDGAEKDVEGGTHRGDTHPVRSVVRGGWSVLGGSSMILSARGSPRGGRFVFFH